MDYCAMTYWLYVAMMPNREGNLVIVSNFITFADLYNEDDYLKKRIYVIRHCEAEGQPKEAQLTEKGSQQAADLAEFFSDVKINRIITVRIVNG